MLLRKPVRQSGYYNKNINKYLASMVNAYGKDLDIFNDKDLFLCNVSGNSIINNWPKK